jgi:hypothetical protein
MMKYAAEFETHSENIDHVSEVLRRALLAAFGSVENFNLTSVRTYVAALRPGQPFEWKETIAK